MFCTNPTHPNLQIKYLAWLAFVEINTRSAVHNRERERERESMSKAERLKPGEVGVWLPTAMFTTPFLPGFIFFFWVREDLGKDESASGGRELHQDAAHNNKTH